VSPAPRALLAEADASTRLGVRLVLTRCGFEIVGEARDGDSALGAACDQRPDLALLAADLPGDGIETARKIAARLPGTKIVLLTAHQNGEELVAAVRAGASGYLGKDISEARLPLALTGILAGEAAVPRRYTEYVLEALRGRDVRRARLMSRTHHSVTDRQWEILDLLAEGRSTAEMARRLGISEVTARRHISSVLPKLGLRDRASAIELLRDRSTE
jgi:DNA-binding NarL/FixJ family response regulator